jgi:hypothetical protein
MAVAMLKNLQDYKEGILPLSVFLYTILDKFPSLEIHRLVLSMAMTCFDWYLKL